MPLRFRYAIIIFADTPLSATPPPRFLRLLPLRLRRRLIVIDCFAPRAAAAMRARAVRDKEVADSAITMPLRRRRRLPLPARGTLTLFRCFMLRLPCR